MKLTCLRFSDLVIPFFVVFLFSCTDEIKPGVKKTGIVINEVAARGDDWLELYNDTDGPVNLSGYKVYDDPDLPPYVLPSLNIPSGGYLILFCDSSATGTSTNFKLSSGGESVYLEDASGSLIDFVEFPALSGSQSWARFPDGADTWKITGVTTQAASNGDGPFPTIRNAVRTPLVPGTASVVAVTAEVSDAGTLTSVKLYYRTNAGPWQSVAMSASGSVYSASIPALGTTGSVEYYMEAVNNSAKTTYQPSEAPQLLYQYLINTDALPVLYINEYLAVNTSCCPDNDGGTVEYDDWIEIYNPGNTAVNLADYYLSDDLTDPFKFRIASTAPQSTTIAPGGFLVITADEQGSQGVLHANFRLSQVGETVGLYYKDGRTIDERVFGAQNANQSEGRSPNGSNTWKKMSPSRGASNP